MGWIRQLSWFFGGRTPWCELSTTAKQPSS
jgi:hypothetical protein